MPLLLPCRQDRLVLHPAAQFFGPVSGLLAGLLAAFGGRRGLACSIAVSLAGFLVLAASAWTSVGALMLNPLEERFARPALPEKIVGIVVLGGGFEGADQPCARRLSA